MSKFVKQLRDGKWAVCEEIKVKEGVTVIRPVNDERFDSFEPAVEYIYFGHKPQPQPEPEPEKVVINKNNLPARDRYRVTKLDKGVFVVELWEGGIWRDVKTCKTRSKADEYVATHCAL